MKMLTKGKLLSAGLLVAMSLPVFAESSTAGNTVTDTVITAKIKSGLTTNKATHALNIGVTTNDGVVTLNGTAKSDTEASTAVQIAESTDGVKDVNASDLKVMGSTQPLTDTYITAKVDGMFIKNNLTSGTPNIPVTTIKVETKEGVVYLSGTATKAGIEKAKMVAKSVDGVKEVKSTVKEG